MQSQALALTTSAAERSNRNTVGFYPSRSFRAALVRNTALASRIPACRSAGKKSRLSPARFTAFLSMRPEERLRPQWTGHRVGVADTQVRPGRRPKWGCQVGRLRKNPSKGDGRCRANPGDAHRRRVLIQIKARAVGPHQRAVIAGDRMKFRSKN